MPKRVAKRPTPEIGDVYLARIKRGLFGAVRVIQMRRHGKTKWDYLVVTSPWHGTTRPEITEPALKKVLRLTHHSWGNRREVWWVANAPPSNWELLGSINPTRKEVNESCTNYGYWDSSLEHVMRQYRWDTDREGLLADEAREVEEENRRESDRAHAMETRLKNMTLEKFGRKRRFVHWKGIASSIAIKESRRIFRETIDALIPLNPPKKRSKSLIVIRQSIEQLNNLQEEHHCLTSALRADLIAELDDLFCVSGLEIDAYLITEWIDW